jgi:hypothetical protein
LGEVGYGPSSFDVARYACSIAAISPGTRRMISSGERTDMLWTNEAIPRLGAGLGDMRTEQAVGERLGGAVQLRLGQFDRRVMVLTVTFRYPLRLPGWASWQATAR